MPDPSPPPRNALRRPFIALGATVVIAGTLLTYPGGVPWSALIWLLGTAAFAASGAAPAAPPRPTFAA